MDPLEDAMAELEPVRDDVEDAEVRTKLDSIRASLQEMLDAAAGEETDGDVAFSNTEIAGAAPHRDNLRELEDNLLELAEEIDRPGARERLEAAQRHLEAYRLDLDDDA